MTDSQTDLELDEDNSSEEEELNDDETIPTSASSESLLDLPLGEAFPLGGSESHEITKSRLTSVILLAGTAACGKTTLLGSLYLLFQSAPFAGYLFSGSNTLLGFEKRVHTAKIGSQLRRPTTERSKFSELLHLRVRRQDLGIASQDLLFCDLLGEDFREARDSIDGCKRLPIILRADTFVLLVDGAKIARLDSRQQAKGDALALLRNIVDCGLLTRHSEIDVLTTKWDLVLALATAERDEAERFNRHIHEAIAAQFSGRLRSIHFQNVAAHSPEGTTPLGHGLETLFPKWVRRQVGGARREAGHHLPTLFSEYDRFSERSQHIETKSHT